MYPIVSIRVDCLCAQGVTNWNIQMLRQYLHKRQRDLTQTHLHYPQPSCMPIPHISSEGSYVVPNPMLWLNLSLTGCRTQSHLTEGHKHVPLLLLGNATPGVSDRQLHKLLARVGVGHRLQHHCDGSISGKLGRVAHQVVQDLQQQCAQAWMMVLMRCYGAPISTNKMQCKPAIPL